MIVIGSDTVVASFIYDKVPEGDKHIMDVVVYAQFRGERLWKVGEGKRPFSVSNFLVGKIVIHQENITENTIEKGIIASNRSVTFSFDLHDPSGFFDKFDKSYTWKINGEVQDKETTDKMSRTFVKADPNATVSVYAAVSSKEKKMDRHIDLTRKIQIKDPIPKLKYVGKFFMFRNQSLDLNISCEAGTGPFSLCMSITPGGHRALSCKEGDTVKNNCSFHASWYFKTAGKFDLSIRVANDVSFVEDRIELSVMEVSKQPSLTFVVIPVVCCILAIVIIVFAIAFHVQQRKRFTVEVADFDFQARDESFIEKTFFERVKDSFAASFSGTSCLFCPSRHDINEDHDDLPPQDPGLLTEQVDDGYASTSVHITT